MILHLLSVFVFFVPRWWGNSGVGGPYPWWRGRPTMDATSHISYLNL
jgi:hypothetical protein